MLKLYPIAPRRLLYLVTVLFLLGVIGSRRDVGSLAANAESPQLQRSNRIHSLNGDYFLSGINYPWYTVRGYGGDLATVSYSDGSPFNAFSYDGIDHDFARMEAGGVHVVRWFVFADGRGGPEFDSPNYGKVTGLDADFFAHMDQALEIARRHNIYIIWTLFDFLAFDEPNRLCDGNLEAALGRISKLPDGMREHFAHYLAQTASGRLESGDEASGELPRVKSSATDACEIYAGGHSNLVTDAGPGGAGESFFTNALIPMLQRYGADPNIIGWEIMNEPEWTVTSIDPQVNDPVPTPLLQSFFRRFTTAVHQHTRGQLATVGSAALKWLGGLPGATDPNSHMWNGLGFDYYGVHYYSWMDRTNPSYNPARRDYFSDPDLTTIDAPVVVGEFPASGGNPPIYLPNVGQADGLSSALTLRALCSAYSGPVHDVPCSRAFTARLEYYAPDGTLSATQLVTLPIGGSKVVALPVTLQNWTGSARIVADGPVAAQVVQSNIPAAAETVAYTSQDRGANKLYLPLVVNKTDENHRSRIVLQNTTMTTATFGIVYHTQDGIKIAFSVRNTLAPRGMIMLDHRGLPAGWTADAATRAAAGATDLVGSAFVESDQPLVGVAYELSPELGSDAYAAIPEGYNNVLDLPSVRNWGDGGHTVLVLQNARPSATTATLAYFDIAGAMKASDTVLLPANGSATRPLPGKLPGGFIGAVRITGDHYLTAIVRSDTHDAASGARTLVTYAGSAETWDHFHFPLLSSGGSGGTSTITAQNISASQPITVVAVFSGANAAGPVYRLITNTLQPHGSWPLDVADAVGPGFSGGAEIVWPWPGTWREGFPLFATARTEDTAQRSGYGFNGVLSHIDRSFAAGSPAMEMLEGALAKNWAGALGWAYYADSTTGTWDDYVLDSQQFEQAHQELVDIGPRDFSDVLPGQYFYEAVGYLYRAGVISGYTDGTFRPFANTTRGQLAKIITLASGWAINSSGGPHFSDVAASNTFYAYIETAYNRGVVSGYGDGTFRWGAAVTRGQLAKIVVLANGWNDLPFAKNPHFNDVGTSHTFYRAIEIAYAKGIISGYADGTFRAGNTATRGQISKIVYGAINAR